MYKVDSQTGDHIAIGVVIGSVANHPDMYRAAILSWNLRELQNQEALKISGVDLIRPSRLPDKNPEAVNTFLIKLSCLIVVVSVPMYILYAFVFA